MVVDDLFGVVHAAVTDFDGVAVKYIYIYMCMYLYLFIYLFVYQCIYLYILDIIYKSV